MRKTHLQLSSQLSFFRLHSSAEKSRNNHTTIVASTLQSFHRSCHNCNYEFRYTNSALTIDTKMHIIGAIIGPWIFLSARRSKPYNNKFLCICYALYFRCYARAHTRICYICYVHVHGYHYRNRGNTSGAHRERDHFREKALRKIHARERANAASILRRPLLHPRIGAMYHFRSNNS